MKCLILASLCLGLLNCDSNALAPDDGTNPSASDPTTTVATNVGPVANLVTTDVLNKANAIRGDIEDYLAEATGSDDDDPSFMDTIKFSNDFNQNEISITVDLAESNNCDSGGTKNIIGSATFVLDASQTSGSLTGSFTIQYNNCQDIILMQTSNGNCTITPTVTGELATTISLDYILGSNNFDTNDLTDTTEVSSSNSVALAVSVGATASEQTFSFSYELSTSYSSDNFSGTAGYSGLAYDLSALEDFIQDESTTAICN
ncbi:MAG: hypothetical protein HQM16_01915 [Deltaproteobacteria bacterium]|nr:hypothetical protein [Deltaproteobacteria bacterium]